MSNFTRKEVKDIRKELENCLQTFSEKTGLFIDVGNIFKSRKRSN